MTERIKTTSAQTAYLTNKLQLQEGCNSLPVLQDAQWIIDRTDSRLILNTETSFPSLTLLLISGLLDRVEQLEKAIVHHTIGHINGNM